MFAIVFLLKLLRSALDLCLDLLPSPKLVPGKRPRKPILGRDGLITTAGPLYDSGVEDFDVLDRFKRQRDWFRRGIRWCNEQMAAIRDRHFAAALRRTNFYDGVMDFPLNVLEPDAMFFRWNMMAGTLMTPTNSSLLSHRDIERALDNAERLREDRAATVKRLKSAAAKMRRKPARVAYDLTRDKFVERW